MSHQWIKYHALFLIITWLFNYFFNFQSIIPEGEIFIYTLFFVIEYTILSIYFYVVMIISATLLDRMNYFIPLQLLFMQASCFFLTLIPWGFNLTQHARLSYLEIYFLKMFEVVYFTVSGIAFLFLQKWHESSNRKIKLLNSISEVENMFLRSQMSPHSLLNIFNTIYALSLSNSVETSSAIAEIKVIYSYLKQIEKQKVSLFSEVNFLHNYINIQKRRYGNCVKIHLDIDIDQDYLIEPFILTSFIENAFKHGTSMKHPSQIYLKLLVKKGRMDYEVLNTDYSQKSNDTLSGIGLQNLRRRLQFLYANSFNLECLKQNEQYVAKLNLLQI